MQARILRTAVQTWRTGRSSADCATVADLTRDRALIPDLEPSDPWGVAYRIDCGIGEVTVTSAGPDRQWQTTDDVVVPKAARRG